MTINSRSIHLSTKGHCDIHNITPQISEHLNSTQMKDGIMTASMIGSTGALTTCEFEDGLVQDLKEFFDRIIPAGDYHHDRAWGDGNGHSHLRSSLVGPSVTIPFKDGSLVLGTWQQIIFIDFDNRARKREIFLQFVGM